MLYRISRSFFFARSTALLYYRASVSRKFRTRRDVLLSRCRGITSGNIEDGIHRKRKVITRCHWVKYNSKRNAKAVVNRGTGISFLPWISVLFRGILPFAYPPLPPQCSFIIQMEFRLSRIVAGNLRMFLYRVYYRRY